jgi:hypothetical protein
MKFRVPLFLLLLALPPILSAREEKATPAPTPKPPSLLHRMLHPFEKPHGGASTTATGFKQLEIALQVEPAAVKVPEVRQMKVTVTLANRGHKIVQLDFPSTQRIEVLVKSKEGKIIEQWSEDQAFANEPSIVAVNPNERLEYTVSVSTRDMVAGETYSVEGFFPNFEHLRKAITVTAEK